MSNQSRPIQFEPLHEHDFHSSMPALGRIVGGVRALLYRLTAKWGVLDIINQQTHLNALMADYLMEHQRKLEQLLAFCQQQAARQTELAARQTELDARQTELDARQTELDARQTELAARQTELDTRQTELDARLIDQDRDLALLARTVAELDLRQRYQARIGQSNTSDEQV